MIRRYLPRDIQQLVRWYERYISPLALIAGFVADNLFLTRRVDLWQTNALLGSYLVIAAVGIALINMLETGRIRNERMVNLAPLVPVVVQFAFGGLFSGFLSLYSRSASIAVSWIFVVALVALLLGNERFTRLYVRFPFQIGVYFAVLFSFLIFSLPVLFKQLGIAMFLISGGVSLAVVALLMLVLWRLAPGISWKERRSALVAIAVIYAVINMLYFSGAIPPLPLSLKVAGVYHSIVRQPDGSYTLLGEQLPWYRDYLQYDTEFKQSAGDPVYVWSVIFAPAGLSTIIEHEWQRYDDTTRTWVTTDTLSFAINGGRDGGYRGYSLKSGVAPGRWRVNVITGYGQLIGRIGFTVVSAASAPVLVQTTQ